ncbi:hypothetical protein LguiA_015340 [Lonicera macranthoides]
MAALETPFSILSSFTSTPPKSRLFPPSLSLLRSHISTSIPTLSLKFPPLHPHPLYIHPIRKLGLKVGTAVEEEVAVQQQVEDEQEITNLKKKLFVLNLPWSFTVVDVKTLFGECGTVTDAEIIKQKNGKSRGFAFVTMASREEAQAVIDKFDSHELSGRIVRIEFAKKFKKPSPPPSPTAPAPGETRHKLYVSNLAWKVRSTHLREFFATNFKLVSARVVFDSPSGKSSGYGFVSFATKEEAEAAISDLDGKELFGRPISLKFSVKNVEESVKSEKGGSAEKPEKS